MRPLRPLLPLILACLLAGCGGAGSADSTPSSAAKARDSSPADGGGKRILVAALGDSITAGSPLWDPDPAIRAQIGAALDKRSQYEYWVHRREHRIVFRNCGVFGERTDEIALRFDDCARDADILIVQGGINDIAQGRSPESVAENLEGIVIRAKGEQLPVAVTEILPWNNGHPGADAAIDSANRAIARMTSTEGVVLLPFHDPLESKQVPGTMTPSLTIDGDHPSVAGYRLLARKGLLAYLNWEIPRLR